MAVTIRVKRGTATQWAARTTPLLSGEIGYDLTNKITKIGDGATLWATLPSIDSSGASNTGDITFDGVQVIGAGTASGDGYGLGTLELVPDGNITSDQYLIIDPTAPNHIHIRAGGTQDASNADLFLGGERNNVHISDGGRNLSISTRPEQVINTYVNANEISNTQFIISNSANINIGDTLFSIESGDTATVNSVTLDSPNAGSQTVTAELGGIPAQFISGSTYIFIHEESYNNQWIFDSDGYLYGPGEGVLLLVEGIYNAKSHLTLQAMGINNKVILDGQNGEFINDASDPENQIATLGDITAANEYTDQAVSSLGDTIDGAYVPISDVGNAGGVASLDLNGKIPLSELGNLIDGAPTALDTLNELAAAINDDSSFASTITTALGNKLDSNYVTIGNTLLEGISGQTYGLIGTSTYLDVKNTNGYNKEIELDIAAVKSQLDTDGYIKQAALDLKLNISDPSVDYYITNSGSGSYTVNGVANGLISFDKGKRYRIYVNASGHPFWIQTVSGAYSSGDVYSTGITGNGTQVGSILVELPDSAPAGLYYACQYHSSMAGAISVKNAGIGLTTNTQSSSYTLAIIDSDKIIEMSGGGTLTIADSSSFPVGFTVDVLQTGSSQVTIAGSGFTPNATPGLKLRTQWSSATLIKRALNSWVVLGDLSA